MTYLLIKADLDVRPRPVQSVRYGHCGFFVDKSVRLWKQEVVKQLTRFAPERPYDGPVVIRKLEYRFRLPTQASANTDKLCCLFEAINGIRVAGTTKKARLAELGRLVGSKAGALPYLARADLTDNLNKGLIDCMSGLFFTDDRLIWQLCNSTKVYGLSDRVVRHLCSVSCIE